eukprot:CAMPEP_0115014726 /NCGR_PEP_ID=MMETSP0216-20121206/26274_1 /TAXON_ID=223996 /ORGANISM="Protocruzia adherens, Strain Boccale" /LENGTH=458 /DNA_ID=CAMNT_0002384569 /DNA_START=154 /DNA_END=1530 /DNA_ORIENTATION=-
MISFLLAGFVSNLWRQKETFPERLQERMQKLKVFYQLWKFRRMAESLNHLQALVTKMQLGVPVRENETEIQSYLDTKRALAKNWPFMWTVKGVRDSKIEVDGDYHCETFSSYSYLDFVRDTEISKAAIATARMYSAGNHAPRAFGGKTQIICDFEEELAEFYGREAAVISSGGYISCMSAVRSVAHAGDLIVADQFAHASLRSGCKLSGAKTCFFKHNNFAHAEEVIKKNKRGARKIIIIAESVDKYGGYLIMDEAHSLGTLGKTGHGIEEYYNMPGAADLIVGSLAKSLASVGGFICGSKDTIEYFEQASQSSLFSAPLSAYHVGGARKALSKIIAHPEKVTALHENAAYLRQKLATAKWSRTTPETMKFQLFGSEDQPVVPVVYRDNPMRVLFITSKLKQAGYLVGAVVAPACPLREPRLRVSAQSTMTKESIDAFVDTLIRISEETQSENDLKFD